MSKDVAQFARRGETLARLGEFLLARREDILRLWIAAVDRSPDITSSDDLTYKQLLDHFPQLCAELAERLMQHGRKATSSDPNLTSAVHGRERWQQGYRLEEVIRELSLIRRSLFERWLPDFANQESFFGNEEKQDAEKVIHEFFDEVIVAAVSQFVAESAENRKQIRHQFLSLMSHELRTPLTPALLATETLRRDPNLSEDALEMIEVIARNIELEARLIDELLEVSERGSSNLPGEPAELGLV